MVQCSAFSVTKTFANFEDFLVAISQQAFMKDFGRGTQKMIPTRLGINMQLHAGGFDANGSFDLGKTVFIKKRPDATHHGVS
jgi:hypothetical protein